MRHDPASAAIVIMLRELMKNEIARVQRGEEPIASTEMPITP